jgi:hypothetical protein
MDIEGCSGGEGEIIFGFFLFLNFAMRLFTSSKENFFSIFVDLNK